METDEKANESGPQSRPHEVSIESDRVPPELESSVGDCDDKSRRIVHIQNEEKTTRPQRARSSSWRFLRRPAFWHWKDIVAFIHASQCVPSLILRKGAVPLSLAHSQFEIGNDHRHSHRHPCRMHSSALVVTVPHSSQTRRKSSCNIVSISTLYLGP